MCATAMFAAMCAGLLGIPVSAKEGDFGCFVPGPVSLQDIAYDPVDDVYWVTNFLSNAVHKFSNDLTEELDVLQGAFSSGGFPTGIAYNSLDDTLLVVEVLASEIVELNKDGTVTGRRIRPDLRAVGVDAFPTMRGLAFDPTGDGGRGSVYGIESTSTIIYEVALTGDVLSVALHPDDDDGVIGGLPASASDVDLIYEDDKLVGFYLTGGLGRIDRIVRTDLEGRSTGVHIPLDAAGGTVSSILRRDVRCNGEEEQDSFLCGVESNARFALIEGGEPDFRELVEFACETSENTVRLSWRNTQPYERIEVWRDCEVLETLPGDAEEWQRAIDVEGIYTIEIRAVDGDNISRVTPCTLVIGSGAVVSSQESGGRAPIDLAQDGRGTLYATDGLDRTVLIYDAFHRGDVALVGSFSLHTDFVGDDDFVGGIAYDRREPNRIYIMNVRRARLGIHDEVGALLDVVDVDLPDLEDDPEAEEPDFGFVEGMTFDATGDGGRGSLWLVETDEDFVYEINLDGRVLRSFPHPYKAVERPPANSPFGIPSGGIVSAGPDALWLSGGALRSRRDVHFFQVRKDTGEPIEGSVIPTADLSAGSFTLESLADADGPRLVILEHRGSGSRLTEIVSRPSPVGTPTFLTARQAGVRDQVELRWRPQGPYDLIEVERNCEKLTDLDGSMSSFLDDTVSPGLHSYRVRGIRDGQPGDFTEVEVQVGIGAVLKQRISWPALSPQQLTRDPVDGTFYVSVNWPGDERKLYHYDRDLRFIEVRDSAVASPFQIASLAIRKPPQGRREIYTLTWRLPVPIDNVAGQRFFAVKETIDGALLDRFEILPPRPTNGFITFPTGLAWDDTTDTFYYLERNSKTFVEMAPDGTTLREFPHPSPPFQNSVFALGVDFVSARDTLFITGADEEDHRVTKVMEMTKGGRLTGTEIPLDNLPPVITGITIHGSDLIAVGTERFSEIFRIKALPEEAGEFVRGDANDDGDVNLTDVVLALNYLFLDGPLPPCEDAVDTSDDGEINLQDPLVLLNFLFDAGPPSLPAPFPTPGLDLTPDGLVCP